MMIASSSRMGMIAKLTLLVLVFLGFGVALFSSERAYACGPGDANYDWVTGGCDSVSPNKPGYDPNSGPIYPTIPYKTTTDPLAPKGITTVQNNLTNSSLLGNKTYQQTWNDCIVAGGNSTDCTQKATFATDKTRLSKYDQCRQVYGKGGYCDCKYGTNGNGKNKGIYLNTEVPFVGDPNNPRCLIMETASSSPVNVLRSLTKILMTFVMIGGFGMIVWGGVQIAGGDVKGGKDKIIGVAIAFALLGSLGVILRFINPNFFS